MTGLPARLRPLAAAALLAAVTIAWAALPTAGADAGLRPLLVVAVLSALASLIRLAVGDTQIGGDAFDAPLVRLAAGVAGFARSLPWSEVMIIAVLGLEALHHARPWHTGVLGVALLAQLFTTHLAETRARLAVLVPQLPVIAAGAGLLVLAVGAGALARPHAGTATDLLRVLAVIAAVIAAGLALPVGRNRPGRSQAGGAGPSGGGRDSRP